MYICAILFYLYIFTCRLIHVHHTFFLAFFYEVKGPLEYIYMGCPTFHKSLVVKQCDFTKCQPSGDCPMTLGTLMKKAGVRKSSRARRHPSKLNL